MWGFLSKELCDASVYLDRYTNVWPISRYDALLAEIKANGKILLGGDILSPELQHTYDSWYYNREDGLSDTENCARSVRKAKEYLENYIARNGEMFYLALTVVSA